MNRNNDAELLRLLQYLGMIPVMKITSLLSRNFLCGLGIALIIGAWALQWYGIYALSTLFAILALTIVVFLPEKHDKSFPRDQIGM